MMDFILVKKHLSHEELPACAMRKYVHIVTLDETNDYIGVFCILPRKTPHESICSTRNDLSPIIQCHIVQAVEPVMRHQSSVVAC